MKLKYEPSRYADFLFFGSILLLMSFVAYIYQSKFAKPCCDAIQYIEIARNPNLSHNLRTFGYPFFLSFLDSISTHLKLPLSFLIWISQTTFYILASSLLSLTIAKISPSQGRLVFILLSLNVFIIPYLAISLSDAFSTTLILIVFALLIRLSFKDNNSNNLPLIIFFSVFFTSFAVITRPSNIWLFAPLLTSLFCVAKRVKNFRVLFFCICIGLAPIALQIAINTENFNKISFFPVIDLGAAQIKWGIENIKYATWLGEGPTQQNFYPSKSIVDIAESHLGWAWYFHNPFDGLKLLVIKFFAAFDFDYILPYPRSAPALAWLFTSISIPILFLGLTGVAIHAAKNNMKSLGFRFTPLVFIISWAAVTLVSALELRFTLPALVLFLAVTPSSLDWIYSLNKTAKTFYLLSFIAFCIFSSFILLLVRSIATIQN